MAKPNNLEAGEEQTAVLERTLLHLNTSQSMLWSPVPRVNPGRRCTSPTATLSLTPTKKMYLPQVSHQTQGKAYNHKASKLWFGSLSLRCDGPACRYSKGNGRTARVAMDELQITVERQTVNAALKH